MSPHPPETIPSAELYQQLVGRLSAWCQHPAHAWWVAEAGRRFYLWEERYAQKERQWLLPWFAVWLVHEYRSVEGETVAGRILAEEAGALEPEERRALEVVDRAAGQPALLDRFRLVEVTRQRSDGRIELRDVLDGEPFVVPDLDALGTTRAPWARGGPPGPGDSLLVRFVPVDTGLLVACATRLGAGDRELLLEHLATHGAELRSADPGLRPGDVLRLRLPALLHALLEAEGWRRAGLTADGEPILLSRAHFRLRDSAALRAALRKHPSFEERDPDRFVWRSGRRRRAPLTGLRLVLGQVLLEESRAVLETNARARVRRGSELLHRIGGGALEHLLDEYSDVALPDETPAATRFGEVFEGATAEAAPSHPRDELDDAVGCHVRHHLRQWLDAPSPVLEDRSPREAVRDPRLRAQVGQLLSDLEGRLVGEVVSTSFFIELRQELGLLLED